MKKEPKIFAIIVTYKGMRWYDKCFSSLREITEADKKRYPIYEETNESQLKQNRE